MQGGLNFDVVRKYGNELGGENIDRVRKDFVLQVFALVVFLLVALCVY
jgi:hypothetical protein